MIVGFPLGTNFAHRFLLGQISASLPAGTLGHEDLRRRIYALSAQASEEIEMS